MKNVAQDNQFSIMFYYRSSKLQGRPKKRLEP